jgi:predicted nucleotidyltransferase
MKIRADLDIDEERLAALCRRYRVTELALFGSVLRDDFGPDSDVDVLYELDASAEVDLFDLARLRNELSDLVGREVDLVWRDGVASRPRCKSTAGVGSFQALQAVKGTHTRVHASIPARARPRRD